MKISMLHFRAGSSREMRFRVPSNYIAVFHLVASPDYLEARGHPKTLQELAASRLSDRVHRQSRVTWTLQDRTARKRWRFRDDSARIARASYEGLPVRLGVALLRP